MIRKHREVLQSNSSRPHHLPHIQKQCHKEIQVISICTHDNFYFKSNGRGCMLLCCVIQFDLAHEAVMMIQWHYFKKA